VGRADRRGIVWILRAPPISVDLEGERGRVRKDL